MMVGKSTDKFSVTSNNVKLLKHLDNLKSFQMHKSAPIMVHLMLTNQCNLRCPTCCFRDSNNDGKYLSLDFVKDVMGQFSQLGVKAVELSVRGNETIPFKKDEYLYVETIKDVVDSRALIQSFAVDDSLRFVEDKVTSFFKHKQMEPLLKITLEGGRNITTTKSHSIFFLNDNSLFLKKCSEAKVGDVVALSSNRSLINNQLQAYNVLIDNRQLCLDEDFWRLLGFFVAEGSFTFQRQHVPHGIVFTFGSNSKEQRYIQDVVATLKKFGFKPHVDTFSNKTNIRVSNTALCEFLLFNPLFRTGQGAKNKRVPNIIYNLTPESQMEFLKGLYGGDGNFRNTKNKTRAGYRNSLEIKTASVLLQKTLSFLLDCMNIQHTLSEQTVNEGLIEGRKLPKRYSFSVSITGKSNINALLAVVHFLEKKPQYQQSVFSHQHVFIKPIIVNENLYGLKIKKIEQLKTRGEEVFDISVAGTHRFESSFRILCHNTGGGDPTMYKDLNNVLSFLKVNGYTVGMNTNGHLADRITEWGALRWVRLSMNTLDFYNRDTAYPIEYIKKNAQGLDITGCYVWNEKGPENLGKVVAFANKEQIITRVVPDCIVSKEEIETQMSDITRRLEGFTENEYVFVSDHNVDVGERPNKNCYMHHIKPTVFTDGYVYSCPSSELSIDNSITLMEKFRVCHGKDVFDYYSKNFEVFQRDCYFCKYKQQNALLEDLLVETTHNEFC